MHRGSLFIIGIYKKNQIKEDIFTYYIYVARFLMNQTTPLAFGLVLDFCFVYHSHLKRFANIDLAFKTIL